MAGHYRSTEKEIKLSENITFSNLNMMEFFSDFIHFRSFPSDKKL